MPSATKVDAVAELADSFRNSSGAVLTEYRGLSVAQLKQLRRALADNASFEVVKNTLTKLAAERAGVEGLSAYLSGPSAVAFVTGDPVEAAKGLRDFARGNPALVIKGGVLDGRPLSVEELTKLADLESREVLLAKLAGAMQGTMARAAGLFSAPLAQAARLMAALQAKREEPVSEGTADATEAVEGTADAATEAVEASADS